MDHHKTTKHPPGKTGTSGAASKGLQIAKLRRAFGLTQQQAALVAALLYGEASE